MERLVSFALLSAIAWGVHAQDESARFPGAGLELAGRLYRPEGGGPFPAIVMLHGCGGMWSPQGKPTSSYASWARHFQARGYVALLVDSFGPRGEREICTQQERAIAPQRERAADAMAALAWLAARPDVDRGRIHLIGWSNGGSTVLHAVRGRRVEGSLDFRSAVAFYPGCRALLGHGYVTRVPLLILAGGADDWTPARHCEDLAAEASKAGSPIDIDVYPGAHHSFDRLGGRIRYRPEVRNPTSPTGRGATVGPDPVARAQSHRRTTDFLSRHGER